MFPLQTSGVEEAHSGKVADCKKRILPYLLINSTVYHQFLLINYFKCLFLVNHPLHSFC